MPTTSSPPTLFPDTTTDYILSFQFSSWYPKFTGISVKSTIIRPLSKEFQHYLDSDGVFVPEGSEDFPAESTLSDDDSDQDDNSEPSDDPTHHRFAFPELDAQIRACIKSYGAVFPKLNFSSPKDASWILPASSPLKCTSPSDIYLLLKSSDFVSHDLSIDHVFEGCELPGSGIVPSYDLELVIRKWYPIDRSREFRCFVRQDILLGVSQRDPNYYEFLNEPITRDNITTNVKKFWETNVKGKWEVGGDYTFDLLLTRDLSNAHVLDFNPYAPRTDPLLFTYDDLLALLLGDRSSSPQLRVIDSRSHPAANRNAPTHQHNMVPFEALSLGSGRDIETFAEVFQDEIKKSMDLDDDL